MDYIFSLQFLLVFVLAFLFGIERQLSHKPIGFGTFTFVALGSCALGITAMLIEPNNPLPLLGAIVTGIGFLGAGALIKTTDKIFGFTTAASIWVFAIIGLLIGIGKYSLGLIIYGFVWVTVVIDKSLESKSIGAYQKKITIKTKKVVDKAEVLKIFGNKKWRMTSLSYNDKDKSENLSYIVSLPKKEIENLKQEMLSKKWIEFFKIE